MKIFLTWRTWEKWRTVMRTKLDALTFCMVLNYRLISPWQQQHKHTNVRDKRTKTHIVRPHSHWHVYQLRVIHTSETHTSGAFTVTRTSTNTCNSDAIKNLVKIVKYLHYLQFRATVYSNIADNVVPNCLRQNYVISLLCAVKISNITCLLVRVA